jgi:molybdate transport system substrate-binding protein
MVNMNIFAAIFALLVALLSIAAPVRAAPLLVGAATDLTHCIDELAAAFRREAPQAEVKVSLGASGNLAAQIRGGAPFDVFMSADLAYPAKLASEGAADGTTLRPYALGQLAIWTLDPRFDPQLGMKLFADSRLTRVAIANPDVAPYGRAAKTALEQAGLWQALQPKLVIGESVAQATQFIQSGNAQLGLISLSSVLAPQMPGVGRYAVVPVDGLTQGAIVTKHGTANPLAARFVAFLGSPVAQAILLRNGFRLPPTTMTRDAARGSAG